MSVGKRAARSLLPVLYMLCLTARGADSVPPNLIANGGFEDWGSSDKLGNVRLKFENNQVPSSWIVTSESSTAPTSTLAIDQAVKHSGCASMRIRNERSGDIGRISSMDFGVLPNRTYTCSIWYRMERVAADGDGGVVVSVAQGPNDASFAAMAIGRAIPKPNSGSLDWRRVELVFTTSSTTWKARLDLSLQRAAGTVWFDDITIEPDAARPVFQADFSGPGEGTGGRDDLVSIGGTGKLYAGPSASNSIGNAPGLHGNYINTTIGKVPASTSTLWADVITIKPLSPASSPACLYSGTVTYGGIAYAAFNGGFDVVVRLKAPDYSNLSKVAGPGKSALWFRPMSVTNKANGGMDLYFNGSEDGDLILSLHTAANDAISNFAPTSGATVPAGASGRVYYLCKNDAFPGNPGSVYHAGFTFNTDATGLVTARLFIIPGAEPIRTRSDTPAAAATFRVLSNRVTTSPLSSGPWTVQCCVGSQGEGTSVDLGQLRLFNRDPGMFR